MCPTTISYLLTPLQWSDEASRFKIEVRNVLKTYGHEQFENHNQIRWHRKLFWTLIYRSLNALQKILEEDYFFLDVVCISSVHLGMAVDCVYSKIDVKFWTILVLKIRYCINLEKSKVIYTRLADKSHLDSNTR